MNEFKTMTQEQTTLQWLSERQGIDLSGNKEHQELAGFFLLWTTFEKIYFQETKAGTHNKHSLEKIKIAASKIGADYSELLNSIDEWYFRGKEHDYFFRRFSGQKKAYKDFFKDYLEKEEHTPEEEKVFVLAIIYQYRCNAFHGSKELGPAAHRQRKKIGMFNRFLIACLD